MPILTGITAALAVQFTISSLAETVLTGYIGNRADAILTNSLSLVQRLQKQFSDTQVPVNHHLQKAILSAHWMATKVFAEQFRKLPVQQDALKVILQKCDEQLKKYKKEDYCIETDSPDSAKAGELLSIKELPESVEALRQSVIAFHVEELRRYCGESTTKIQEFNQLTSYIQNGWADQKLDWFTLMTAFLHDLLLGDRNKAKDAFQNQELAKIGVDVAYVKEVISALEKLTQNAKETIGVERFEEFWNFVKIELSEIKDITLENLEVSNKILDKIEKAGIADYPKVLSKTLPGMNWDNYVDRTDFLQDLQTNILQNLRTDFEAGKHILLLNGLGGMGKSTLAMAYAREFNDQYEHIAWLNQTDTFENMLVGDTILNENLRLKFNSDEKDVLQIVEKVFAALNRIEGKKLLVLDNVEETLKLYRKLLPSQWHILLTSRQHLGDNFDHRTIGKLTYPEAKALTAKHFSGDFTDDELRILCEEIGYHTLTLELLIKTLAASFELTNLSELTHYIKSNRLGDEDLEVFVNTNQTDEEVQVYTYLLQTFTLAKLNEVEKDLLVQFAVLPPLPISYNSLIDWLQVADKKTFTTTLEGLVKKGWIDKDKTTKTLSMHRMVQQAVRFQEKPTEERCKALVIAFTELLNIDQTKDNPVDKFKWIDYGEYIYKSLPLVSNSLSTDVINLIVNLAFVLRAYGNYHEAQSLLEKILFSIEKNLKGTHSEKANIYSQLGNLLKDLGKNDKAEELLRDALAINEKYYGSDLGKIAINYSNLGLVLKNLGKLKEAKIFLEKAVKINQKLFGTIHVNNSVVYSNLAIVLHDLGENKRARILLEDAIESAKKTHDFSHPELRTWYNNLGLILIDLGDFTKAKEMLEESVAMHEVDLGEAHVHTANVYNSLAIVLSKIGPEEYDEAEVLYQKALHIYEQKFSSQHFDMCSIYFNYGVLLARMKKFESALTYCEKGYQVHLQSFAESDPKSVLLMSNIQQIRIDSKHQHHPPN